MHWRPGIVSHSLAEAPTRLKNCWLTRRCSREPVRWPTAAFTTALRMYSCGIEGSRSLMSA